MSFNPSTDFKTDFQTDFDPSCFRRSQKILQLLCPTAHPCLSAGARGSAPFPPSPLGGSGDQAAPVPTPVPTVSLPQSPALAPRWWHTSAAGSPPALCFAPAVSSLALQPSASLKSRGTKLLQFLQLHGWVWWDLSTPENAPTPSTAAHFSWHWFYWHVLTWMHAHRTYRIWPLVLLGCKSKGKLTSGLCSSSVQ